jgi:hypothetical protein
MARRSNRGGTTDGRTVQVRYRQVDGELVETSLERVVVGEVVAGLPVRELRWDKGRKHYSGRTTPPRWGRAQPRTPC